MGDETKTHDDELSLRFKLRGKTALLMTAGLLLLAALTVFARLLGK